MKPEVVEISDGSNAEARRLKEVEAEESDPELDSVKKKRGLWIVGQVDDSDAEDSSDSEFVPQKRDASPVRNGDSAGSESDDSEKENSNEDDEEEEEEEESDSDGSSD